MPSFKNPTNTLDGINDYSTWTQSQLVDRVLSLEGQLRTQIEHTAKRHSSQTRQRVKARAKRQFDPSKYNTRYTALKIAYLGQNYNGFEYHANNRTALPTVEEELWKAFSKTKLIFPVAGTEGEINWTGCEYSKCGRTDKGVSAFGQVIALKLRSGKPKVSEEGERTDGFRGEHIADGTRRFDRPFDPIEDEWDYPKLLNRVLPPDIRVLAWCPSLPEGFSARFSCAERRYKYFFTQPAYSPTPGRPGLDTSHDGFVRRFGWLDIPAMKRAAKYFEGTHDFRNFCKLDGGRQITNFTRTVFEATIEEAPSCSGMLTFTDRQAFGPSTIAGHQFARSKVLALSINGSAFLWHQVRHIASILFLVGQRLESPEIVRELLDVGENPCKPMYEMADDAPLVLWDCVFPAHREDPREDGLPWVYAKSTPNRSSTKDDPYRPGSIDDVLWRGWRRHKINEVLSGNLLDLVQSHGDLEPAESTTDGVLDEDCERLPYLHGSTKIFNGGNNPQLKGEYTPLLRRQRMEQPNVLNAKYVAKKEAASTTYSFSTGTESLLPPKHVAAAPSPQPGPKSWLEI